MHRIIIVIHILLFDDTLVIILVDFLSHDGILLYFLIKQLYHIMPEHIDKISVFFLCSVSPVQLVILQAPIWGQRAIINGMITAQLSQSPNPAPIQDDTQ